MSEPLGSDSLLEVIWMKRRTIRMKVVQALYELEFQPQAFERIVNDQQERLDESDFQFFYQLITGVQEKKETVDRMISKYLKAGWTLDRISMMERSILRLAVYELLFREETPPKVAINEAVELAKQFGDVHSKRFINGVLGKLIRENEKKEENE